MTGIGPYKKPRRRDQRRLVPSRPVLTSLRQTALTAPIQAQTPPATSTDVRSSILMPPFYSPRLSRSIICGTASGSCASTAQAALRASSSLSPSVCCIRPRRSEQQAA